MAATEARGKIYPLKKHQQSLRKNTAYQIEQLKTMQILQKALEGIEKQRARDRMIATQNNNAAKETFPELVEISNGQTRDKVAQQTGEINGDTIQLTAIRGAR